MLPQPTDAFDWVQAAGSPALVCRPLAGLAPHLFTTRGWALGSRTGEDSGDAWDQVAAAMQVDRSQLVRVHQVHGASVVVRRANQPAAPAVPASRPDADIILSNDWSFALAIQTADCVPLLISYRAEQADGSGAVVAAHAGWRGLAARVPMVAVDAVRHEFGARPADL